MPKIIIVIDATEYRRVVPPTVRSQIFESSDVIGMEENGMWRIDHDKSRCLPDHLTLDQLGPAIDSIE